MAIQFSQKKGKNYYVTHLDINMKMPSLKRFIKESHSKYKDLDLAVDDFMDESNNKQISVIQGLVKWYTVYVVNSIDFLKNNKDEVMDYWEQIKKMPEYYSNDDVVMTLDNKSVNKIFKMLEMATFEYLTKNLSDQLKNITYKDNEIIFDEKYIFSDVKRGLY